MLDILIVDDETPIREWIQFSIEREKDSGFRVVGTAKSGEEAYEMALQKAPEVIITDIKMPGMDGITLMKKVKETLPYTQFLILTNYAEFSYAREAITYGAQKYLLKSELRGEDIVDMLKEMDQKKQKILQDKNRDYFSTGYLDLYTCYQNTQEENFVMDFWKRHGLQDGIKYVIVGTAKGELEEQKKIAERVQKEYKFRYMKPILRQQNVYFVLQGLEGVDWRTQTQCFAQKLAEESEGFVVLGNESDSIEEIMNRLTVVEQLLLGNFFDGKDESVVSYEDKIRIPRMSRHQIKKQFQQILMNLSMKEYGTLEEEVKQWFSMFEQVPYEDIAWGREMCFKLLSVLTERYDILYTDDQDPEEIQTIDTIEACKNACIRVIHSLYHNRGQNYSNVIQEAIHYMEEHYMEDISLVDVAGHVYRSSEYFSRLFKQETGENFSIYLMMFRLEKAQNLLKHTDKKIYQIAYDVGYMTPSYFTKIYRRYIGVSPETTRSQYRDRKSK